MTIDNYRPKTDMLYCTVQLKYLKRHAVPVNLFKFNVYTKNLFRKYYIDQPRSQLNKNPTSKIYSNSTNMLYNVNSWSDSRFPRSCKKAHISANIAAVSTPSLSRLVPDM